MNKPVAPIKPGQPPATDWSKLDTQVDYNGQKIILPADPTKMSFEAARATLSRIEEQENQQFDVKEIVKGAPWDALAAVYRAMHQLYGVVLSVSTRSFFGEIKPDLLSIKTGPKDADQVQVPYGQMEVPHVSVPINIRMVREGVAIYGSVKRADRERLVDIRNKAQEILRETSLYRGKAIQFNVDDEGNMVLETQPEFLDLTEVAETDMIHTAETELLIQTNIFAPLKHTEACRQNRIPLKRGVLLEGRYGTGKSLTARVTAKVATTNGWTFIMLNRAQGLRAAIEFGRNYQPCVIFAEDIDRAADRSDEGVNDLVNTLDGVATKDMELMAVLTTNFIDKIDKALLRPGRFDAVISIQPPDAVASERLIRAYSRNLLDASEDISSVGPVLEGQIPATIREVVERAKLSMLTEGRQQISARDLFASAIGMKRHMELIEPKVENKSLGDKLLDVVGEVIVSATAGGDGSTGLVSLLNATFSEVAKTQIYARKAMQYGEGAMESAKAASGSASKGVDLLTNQKAGLAKLKETADEIRERV